MKYSQAFRAQMVKKMTGERAISANELSKESGVAQPTLSKWKRDACRVLSVANEPKPEGRPPRAPKRAQDWTAEEKLRAVMDTAGMEDAELGAYLRSEGLHSEVLETWRQECQEAALSVLRGTSKAAGKGKRSDEQRRIRQLERELNRKEKALAETTALLVLKKKFDTLFEGEESDTRPQNDE